MNFEEPQMEFISLNSNEVVFASAGNVQTCKGSDMADKDWCQDAMVYSHCLNPSVIAEGYAPWPEQEEGL